MKFFTSVLFLCFLLSGIGGQNIDAATYDGIEELPTTIENKDQVDLGAPVKIKLIIQEKEGNIVEFNSNISLNKNIIELFGSTSPYIRITNLDNNEVVYSDFNTIYQNTKNKVKIQQAYPTVKSITIDPGRYEIYYEYKLRVKTNADDEPFRVGNSGGLPILIK
ncbi:hypothetical protein CJ195_09490 [Bacillus sp. UMB0899]|nr:hypothetical protein CJ195_09490 [Bacillus sp. UMB0899]